MTNVIGQRIRRVEDRRFLAGQGHFVDDLRPFDGGPYRDVRALGAAHARITGIDARRPRGAPGTRVFTAEDVGMGSIRCPRSSAWTRHQRPSIASEDVRFIGDVVAVVVTETRRPASTRRSWSYVDYDPLPVVTDARDPRRTDAALRRRRHERRVRKPPRDGRRALRRLRGRDGGDGGQPASGRRAARAAVGDRRLRRRAADGVAVEPDAARGPRRPGGPRSRARQRARDRARRRRRLRRQGPGGRGRDRRHGGAQARPADPLGRDAQREPRRDAPGPRPAHRLQDRRRPRRPRAGPAPQLARRCGAYPAIGDVAAELHRAHGQRRLQDPEDRRRHHRAVPRTRRTIGPFRGAGRPEATQASSARSTCSRRTSGWTQRSCAGSTSSSPTTSRIRRRPA